MTYAETIDFLFGLRTFGTKLGLESSARLAAFCGNPHEKLRFIHVAGTNGKGSTCAMLEAIYRAGGLKVGLFTSPHLVSFCERIQVNRQLISEADVVKQTANLLEFVARENPTTFFEFVTVMALNYFVEQNCDLVIWETGMGGRLDATNIVTPLASVITNIQFDHVQWLGGTLGKIAFEKAGIIKPNVPAITGAESPEALDVIEKVAREKNAPLRIVKALDAQKIKQADLALLGDHQRMNAAVAVAVVEVLQPKISVPHGVIEQGLRTVSWPGRLQQFTFPGGTTVVFDGAHNLDGVRTLRDSLLQLWPGRKPLMLLGMFKDKQWMEMCQMLAPLASGIYLAPVHSQRSANPEELRIACEMANRAAEVKAFPDLAEALKEALRQEFIVVTGSLHFIGEAMELLKIQPARAKDERMLNEWQAAKD